MKVNGIRNFRDIDSYVKYKLAAYEEQEKSFESLFRFMFEETDNIMAETTDGYRIKKITYGQFRQRIEALAPTLAAALEGTREGDMVGLYMANCMEWIELFWAILMCGYRPLLMNTRLPRDVLEKLLQDYSVAAVVSDGMTFPVKTVFKDEVTIPSEKGPLNRPFGKEVIFMSSGTTDEVKLCSYTGENFYHQICDSVNIIEQCPEMKTHYKGDLKQLVLLPLYHVFGFIAVYLWFGFFSRTFVFPKDLNPATIQNTVKKHNVTHIFAVPMVWEAVHKAAMGKICTRGEKTLRKFEATIRVTNRLDRLGNRLAKLLLKEVREGLFGDSICFLITGGSHIKPEAIRFYNGIGYHMANGYGMTEIGITSVEKSHRKGILNSGTIGAPFGHTFYSVDEKGVLLVKGKTMASAVMQKGERRTTDPDRWFSTNDLVRCDKGRYYIEGRADDLIIGEDGENLNPHLAENAIKVDGVDSLCIFRDTDKVTTLIASVPGCFSGDKLNRIYEALREAIGKANLEGTIRRIRFTHEPLMAGNEFKISRHKLAKRVASGQIQTFDPRNIDEHVEQFLSALEKEVRDCFAEALDRNPDSIGAEDDFFLDLGGTSLDYFVLLGLLKSRFGLDMQNSDGKRLSTVSDFCKYMETI